MKIAIDYDETFTADPILVEGFIKLAQARGHEVKFVTYRHKIEYENGLNTDIEYASELLGVDVVYTSSKQKSTCYDADIWLDDSPETIPAKATLRRMANNA